MLKEAQAALPLGKLCDAVKVCEGAFVALADFRDTSMEELEALSKRADLMNQVLQGQLQLAITKTPREL